MHVRALALKCYSSDPQTAASQFLGCRILLEKRLFWRKAANGSTFGCLHNRSHDLRILRSIAMAQQLLVKCISKRKTLRYFSSSNRFALLNYALFSLPSISRITSLIALLTVFRAPASGSRLTRREELTESKPCDPLTVSFSD